MRNILLWPDRRLKQVSLPVDSEQVNADRHSLYALRKLVEEMAVITATHSGAGLSAIQVGVPVRVITTNVFGAPRVFVNPTIISTGKALPVLEGCLSLPGIFEKVRRYPGVIVEFQQLSVGGLGPTQAESADGLLAQVLQHEVDHINGKMFIDYLPAGRRQNIRGELRRRRGL